MYTKEHQRLLAHYRKENIPTKYEEEFARVLDTYDVYYIQQKGFLAGAHTCYIADFYLPKPKKLIIEIDGEYHQDRKWFDEQRDKYFLTRGIKTVRIYNYMIYNKEYINNIIKEYIL